MPTKKILKITYKTVGYMSISLAILYGGLALYSAVQPRPPIFQRVIAQFSPYPIQYEKIQFTWEGLRPGLRIYDFALFNQSEPDLPYVTVEQVNVFLDIPKFLFHQSKKINKIILVGAKFGLYTEDNVQYQLSGFPDLKMSLDKANTLLPVNEILFRKSNIVLSNQKNKILSFTQTNFKINTEYNDLSGNATLLGDKPTYLRFHHKTNEYNEKQHQWYFELFCEEAEQIMTWLPREYGYDWSGKAEIQAWVHQVENQYDFIVKTKMKNAKFIKKRDSLFARHAEGQIKGRYDARKTNSQYEINSAQFNLQGVGTEINAQKYFHSVDAKIEYSDKHGYFFLSSQNGKIEQSRWFDKPLAYKNIIVRGEFSRQENGWTIASDDFRMQLSNNMASEINAKANISLNWLNHKPIFVNMDMAFKPFDINTLSQYLPKKILHAKLTQWLDMALLSGVAQNATLNVTGLLDGMPEYHFKSELENVELRYHQDWPILKNAKIDLSLANNILSTKVHDGSVLGVGIKNSQVTIENIIAQPAIVTANIEANGRLEQVVDILLHSPLSLRLGDGIEPYQFKGDMGLLLHLDLPLGQQYINDIKVDGTITSHNADAYLYKQDIHVNNIDGIIHFSENNIVTEELTGTIWGKEAKFLLQSHYDKAEHKKITMVQAQGQVDIQQATNHFLDENIILGQGDTHYDVDVTIRSDDENWNSNFYLKSNLLGVALDLPQGFGKAPEEIMPFELSGRVKSNSISTSMQHMNYKVSLPNAQLALSFQSAQAKPSEQSKPFAQNKRSEFIGGHLYLGNDSQAQFRSDQKFMIDGSLGNLTLSEYVKVFEVNNLSTVLGDEKNQKMSIVPQMDIEVGHIDLYGLKAQDARIEGLIDSERHNWNFSLVSPEIRGYLAVPQNDLKRVVRLELEHLIIDDSIEKKYVNTPEFNFSHWRFPLEVKIDRFSYKDKKIDNFSAKLEPVEYGYYIKQLAFMMKDTQVKSSGSWHGLSGKNQIDLTGAIMTHNISSILDMIGLEHSLQKAKGDINFSLSWSGSPFKFTPEGLSGEIKFDLKDGSIQGVNPGFGRILSLLSLDNLQKRLSLDFSDVTKKGMAFDKLSGKIYLIDGSIYSDNVTVQSASARVDAKFRTRFDSKHLNGSITVMPDLTGSLPIAVTIASGNPAVGAAVWVMDKLLGPTIQEMSKQEYYLMGSWSDPILKPNHSQITQK